MGVRVLYFAGLREQVGRAHEEVELAAGVRTVADLRRHLAARGAGWSALEHAPNLRAAVNQQMTTLEAALRDGDEVAFFPPVTGG